MRFYIVTRVGHPLSRLPRPVRLEDLYDYSLVLYPQHRPTGSHIAETAQYEYNFDCIDWSRIKCITYVQSRAQYYNLICQTDTISFGFQPFRNQESIYGIVSLRAAPEFMSALGRDINSTLYCIYPEGHALSPLATQLIRHIRALHE